MNARPFRDLFQSSVRRELILEADIREEFQAHLDIVTAEGIERGLAPEEALAQAQDRFGNFEETLRACAREKQGVTFMWNRISAFICAALALLVLALGSYAFTQHHQFAASQQAQLDLLRMKTEPAKIIVQLGDRIELHESYQPGDITGTCTVDRDGTALFPTLGHVPVVGLSRAQVEDTLRERYAVSYKNIDLHVRVLAGE